jgi:transcriptional regulator with XRE-family HTH domain
MTAQDRAFRYIEARNDGQRPSPLRAIGDDADAAIIDLYNRESPPDPEDDAAVERLLQRLGRLYAEAPDCAAAELAPLLAGWRQRSGLSRASLAAALGERLRIQEMLYPKIKRYLADVEHGRLAATRFQSRLTEALASVLGVSADEIRGAARFSDPVDMTAARSFARTTRPVTGDPVMRPDLHFDTVDELFLGGCDG